MPQDNSLYTAAVTQLIRIIDIYNIINGQNIKLSKTGENHEDQLSINPYSDSMTQGVANSSFFEKLAETCGLKAKFRNSYSITIPISSLTDEKIKKLTAAADEYEKEHSIEAAKTLLDKFNSNLNAKILLTAIWKQFGDSNILPQMADVSQIAKLWKTLVEIKPSEPAKNGEIGVAKITPEDIKLFLDTQVKRKVISGGHGKKTDLPKADQEILKALYKAIPKIGQTK